ncbi:hypothetical protein DPMN_176337 [Dreissena polymorpha]|uniref:Uncharacterized protein n=1 Tax=Dreissena polymorpha TaxID=45954 RepID=A0A9D4E8W5_DREPO|nr:hypothetical protein DPMN_176337 [Dreissena polymorpha]
MQRLMGRARTLIPISKGLQKPQADQTGKIASKLHYYRCKQKFFYDRHAKVKDAREPNDAVRITTQTGWRPAKYVRKSPYSRSHIEKAGERGREYRRNTSCRELRLIIPWVWMLDRISDIVREREFVCFRLNVLCCERDYIFGCAYRLFML